MLMGVKLLKHLQNGAPDGTLSSNATQKNSRCVHMPVIGRPLQMRLDPGSHLGISLKLRL